MFSFMSSDCPSYPNVRLLRRMDRASRREARNTVVVVASMSVARARTRRGALLLRFRTAKYAQAGASTTSDARSSRMKSRSATAKRDRTTRYRRADEGHRRRRAMNGRSIIASTPSRDPRVERADAARRRRRCVASMRARSRTTPRGVASESLLDPTFSRVRARDDARRVDKRFVRRFAASRASGSRNGASTVERAATTRALARTPAAERV